MKKVFKFIVGIFYKKEDAYSPYCPECSACGEEGCCPATMCKQSDKGHYCDSYLNSLKFTYILHEKFIKHLYEDEENNKEIIKFYNKLWDETDDKFYKKEK